MFVNIIYFPPIKSGKAADRIVEQVDGEVGKSYAHAFCTIHVDAAKE